ncbi:putative protein disulfide isomerase PDIa [Bodo saltans virus]|uniref:Thioredoxin domain-containing protein n=1 Tax=Bodo saltans virus TaxID=2024608 RepID=A0A2H4UUM8_9VIRU|nr:putative protein disulfide isomerase PDIa [Bodo saltans virus]ATZ80549.1 putative protein disulfide isomerase PDIa [Bodo saltans virus]
MNINISPELEPTIFVIIVLVIAVSILYVFNIILKKKSANKCSCEPPTQQPAIQQEPLKQPELDNKQSNILALYYADWCGYSKIFLPEWEKIKNKVNSGDFGNVKCIQFECTEQKDECMKNKIKGFPSMILHKIDGANINYPDTSPRTLDAVGDFLNNNL